jgi:hypothetical protein
MKAVKVQYTVKDEYVEMNKINIQKVMDELAEINNPGVRYSAFVLNDGNTFVHFAMYPDEETMSIVNNLETFISFRQQLKESQPEIPPKAEDLNLVASAFDIFG